jgi:hypothetical protein
MVNEFIKLAANGVLDRALSSGAMPNIPFPTLGGEVFWNNLASSNGWKLQRNSFTGHCRILDSDNTRHAWGSENAMESLFNKFEKL